MVQINMASAARTPLLLLFAASLVVGLAACDSSGSDGPVRIRVVHAASATGPIDFLVNFDVLAQDLTYREAGPYTQIESGLNLLEIRTEVNGVEVSITREVLMEAGHPYTLVVTGIADATSLVLVEDNRSTPPAGQARVTVAQAAEAAATVSLTLTPDSSTTPTLNISTLAFGTATAPETVDAGRYDITVFTTDGTRTATLTDVVFDVGRRYLIVIAHVGNTQALSLFMIADG